MPEVVENLQEGMFHGNWRYEIDGWDGIDNIIAQMNGWSTGTFEIMVEHRRPTGHHDGIVINCFKSGRTSHIMGYTWTYQIAKSILQMSKWPPLIGGFLCFCFFPPS